MPTEKSYQAVRAERDTLAEQLADAVGLLREVPKQPTDAEGYVPGWYWNIRTFIATYDASVACLHCGGVNRHGEGCMSPEANEPNENDLGNIDFERERCTIMCSLEDGHVGPCETNDGKAGAK